MEIKMPFAQSHTWNLPLLAVPAHGLIQTETQPKISPHPGGQRNFSCASGTWALLCSTGFLHRCPRPGADTTEAAALSGAGAGEAARSGWAVGLQPRARRDMRTGGSGMRFGSPPPLPQSCNSREQCAHPPRGHSRVRSGKEADCPSSVPGHLKTKGNQRKEEKYRTQGSSDR